VSEWWEAPEYDRRAPMNFPQPDPNARVRRVPLTTDAVMEPNEHGQLKLRLVNRHPHEARRIFVGPSHF
jgi:hypothetical protein